MVCKLAHRTHPMRVLSCVIIIFYNIIILLSLLSHLMNTMHIDIANTPLLVMTEKVIVKTDIPYEDTVPKLFITLLE